MKKIISFLLAGMLSLAVFGQKSNQLAPTPPMGWNSWNWFGKNAINEEIIMEVIDAMAAHKLDKFGYEYVVVDGGWRDTHLGPNGELLVHPEKFPNGMKALADYAHEKGFKFGLHTVPGSHDCGGDMVGGWGHEEVHIGQFVDWGIDFIKLDRCRFTLEDPDFPRSDKRWFSGWDKEGKNIEKAYALWSRLLSECGRDILLSASAYRFYDWYPKYTHMGRTTGDIVSLQSGGAVFDGKTKRHHSVMAIAEINNQHSQHAGPGYWNDPDMMVTGEQGLTVEEQKIHFALWCIMSSPLMLGNDPRNMTEEELNIITNKTAIAINQDPTEQGKRIKKEGDAEIWAKKLKNGKTAVLFLNRNEENAVELTLLPEDIGLTEKIKVQNVYSGEKMGSFRESFTQTISPREGLFLLIK